MNYSPIAVARNLRGMTQTQLAAALNVSPQCVYGWTQGQRTPNAETAAKIAKILDVDESWIRGTSQTVPLYDFMGKETFIAPIVRSEELPENAGMLYLVYLQETGNDVALMLHHGEQFTTTDWEGLQPKSVEEIADYRWMDINGNNAIMLNSLPYRFPA